MNAVIHKAWAKLIAWEQSPRGGEYGGSPWSRYSHEALETLRPW